ncbi:MAG: hypothetical protein EON88_30755 [Brevundimonas sp.]|nr:MAG: hypothetical protein EON88_30755 [Brevundimonas sp.]
MDKVRVNGVGALRRRAARALIRVMDKPVTTATEAAAAPEVPLTASATVKPAPATEVATPVSAAAPVAPDVERVRAEKALRLAKALRDNLRRRKVATKAARPSN